MMMSSVQMKMGGGGGGTRGGLGAHLNQARSCRRSQKKTSGSPTDGGAKKLQQDTFLHGHATHPRGCFGPQWKESVLKQKSLPSPNSKSSGEAVGEGV